MSGQALYMHVSSSTQKLFFVFFYLIPSELFWELPVEHIILMQAEAFVDQSILRGERRRGKRGMREKRQGDRGREAELQSRRQEAAPTLTVSLQMLL